MKRSIAQRAQEGAAVLLSSHLLPLVEELCHRVLVIAKGQRVAYGSMAEIRAQVGAAAAGSSLEELFVHITSSATGSP
jgi:ABC-2 type transport system ATP-binding protein